MSVVKTSIFKIHSYKDRKMARFCSENSKQKKFLIAKDEKQTSLRMSLNKTL